MHPVYSNASRSPTGYPHVSDEMPLEMEVSLAARATQERTLGSILGMGIGDAIGMPVTGLSAQEIQNRFGKLDGYHPRSFADGTELKAGEFTDETEIALCIMETYTSANGELDPELIRARMQFLARGESRRWMSAETVRSLDDDAEPWFRSPVDDDPEVALRGIPIGMIHAVSNFDPRALERDCRMVVNLTHSSQALVDYAVLVATAVADVLSGRDDQTTLIQSLISQTPAQETQAAFEQLVDQRDRSTGSKSETSRVIMSAIDAFAKARRFEDAVFAAANQGGAADARAALAGALAGAHFGAGGIPQQLIDDLEGRIYLTLAAPWFYRTIQLMTGRGISMSSNGH
jgi:ADP-ribosylglycohydrolase